MPAACAASVPRRRRARRGAAPRAARRPRTRSAWPPIRSVRTVVGSHRLAVSRAAASQSVDAGHGQLSSAAGWPATRETLKVGSRERFRLAREPPPAPLRAGARRRLRGRQRAAAVPGDRARCARVLSARRRAVRPPVRRLHPGPVVVKEQQHDPVRGAAACTSTARGQARRGDRGRGGDRAARHRGRPRREGGRRARARHPPDHDRGAARPTIPESIPADVSGMAIGDTLQLSVISAPEGVEFASARASSEVTIATLSPPRVEEEPEPELEEEAELVGEEGEDAEEGAEGEEAAEGEGEPRARRGRETPARGSSPCRCSTGCAAERGQAGGARRSSSSGLGNPGPRYAGTRHNLGFEVAAELARRWELPRARERYRGLIAEGRAGPGGPRVALLLPQTFMNESGDSAGPARGSLKVPLERVVVAARRDRPAVRRDALQARRRGRRPQRPARASPRGSAGQTSGAFGSASGGRTRPTPRSSPRYVLGRFAEPEDEVRGADRARRRRGRAAGRGSLRGGARRQ